MYTLLATCAIFVGRFCVMHFIISQHKYNFFFYVGTNTITTEGMNECIVWQKATYRCYMPVFINMVANILWICRHMYDF